MKILIVGPTWIGDTVISQSMYCLLIKRYLKVKIHVITSVSYYSLLNRMPEIDKILISPIKHKSLNFFSYCCFSRFLNSEKYHQAIVLPNSFKSALIPFLARIPKRTGWRGEMRYGLLNDLRILNEYKFPSMVQRYASLAYDSSDIFLFQKLYSLPDRLPQPNLIVNVEEVKDVLKTFNLNDNKKLLIGLCPGAMFGIEKCWPDYHFSTLTVKLINRGYYVLILGSLSDQLISININKKLPSSKILKKNYSNLIGLTSLNQVILLISACSAIVSNDSGLMHVACALKKPVVALYGPTDPEFTPPLFYRSAVLHYSSNFYKKNKFNYDGYHQGLISIEPDQVLEKLENFIKCKITEKIEYNNK